MSLVVPFNEIFLSSTGLLSCHKSWERIELGNVAFILNGYAFASKNFSKQKGFPLIRIRDIAQNTPETYYDGDYPKEYIISTGDFLIGMDGNFACYEWKGPDALLNQRVCKIVPDEKYVVRNFLLYGINGYLNAIQKATSSVTVGHLSSKDILQISFPLPPLPEQRRIIEKLDKLLSKVNACKERLDSIPRILKRFRQSILAAACSGRLTADWRGKNAGVAKYDHIPKQKIELIEPDVPPSWLQTKLGTLTTLVTSGSRGWAKYYAESGSTFIRAQNISGDFLNLDDVAFVKLPHKAEGLRTKVQRDDMLITITGANVTKAALVDVEIEDSYVSQHVALVRLSDTRLSKFLFYSIISLGHGRQQLLDAAYGQGKPGLNLDNIRDVAIAIPPLAEQTEIIYRVETLFKKADAIEARYKKAKEQVDKLTQSILAKAFRGELVAQDPNDEPASVFLERIKAERMQKEAVKESKKPRSAKTK